MADRFLAVVSIRKFASLAVGIASDRLDATPGIEELEVAGLSARGARVTLRYSGGTERLTNALAGQGLALRNADGNWIISAQ